MKINTHSDGLTLIVLGDTYEADVDETKNEKVEEGTKPVDPSKKSELQLLNLVTFFAALFGNWASARFAPATLS